MAARYKLDPTRGRFTVQAFATGLLSALGHSPTFTVRDYRGGMHFEGDEIKGLVLDMRIRADSLELQDRVREADAGEIMERMRRDVLETPNYPEITFRSADVSSDQIAPGRFRVRFGGMLALHGVTNPHRIEAEIQVFGDGVRLIGETSLRLSDYRIKPVSALAGAIKLKDDLKLSFDLVGTPEGP
jgi:polyisoprenoid-binding protein YceI